MRCRVSSIQWPVAGGQWPEKATTSWILPATGHRRLATRSLLLILAVVTLASALHAAPPQRRLASKDCIECHAKVQQEASKKVVHAPFADPKNCESCHKRHGIVGTLVLKQEQPGLCFSCHQKEETAFKAAHVHNPV